MLLQYGDAPSKPPCRAGLLLAGLLAGIILIFAFAALRGDPAMLPENFYTEHGQEEPTRSYVPYVGTVPFGAWGSEPWAEAEPSLRGRPFSC